MDSIYSFFLGFKFFQSYVMLCFFASYFENSMPACSSVMVDLQLTIYLSPG